MTLLFKTPGLARFEVDRLTEKTHTGMAHFAGTGPDGASCDDCFFFRHNKKRSSKAGIFDRFLSGHCAKHAELMGIKGGPAFPAAALACRHFGRRS
jgi:hypothetical protein